MVTPGCIADSLTGIIAACNGSAAAGTAKEMFVAPGRRRAAGNARHARIIARALPHDITQQDAPEAAASLPSPRGVSRAVPHGVHDTYMYWRDPPQDADRAA